MRSYLSESQWETGGENIMASLNIVYCHKPKIMADLIKVQHNSDAHVISTVHVHMSKSHCLEVITLRGSKDTIIKLANAVAGISGIEFSKLFTFAFSEGETFDHGHTH